MSVASLESSEAIVPPSTRDEHLRLKAVSQFQFLFDMPNPVLTQICMLAKSLFGVAFAGVNLVGEKEVVLLSPLPGSPNRVLRRNTFTEQTILSDGVFSVEDVNNLHFGEAANANLEFGMAFYAGTPLRTADGYNIGSLDILDTFPRRLNSREAEQLQSLAFLSLNELLRQRAMLDLTNREFMLSQASRMAKLGSWELDLRTGLTPWSDQMYDLMDQPVADGPLAFNDFLARVAPDDQDRVRSDLGRLNQHEIEIVRPNGQSRWINVVMETNTGGDGIGHVFGCSQDVTELHQSRAEIERLAFHDPLTGLPNRALFDIRFHEAIASAHENRTKVGLLMLDLDHFKEVNDNLGHDAGDALLCSVADVLAQSYRKSDTAARLGGDEFAIILQDIKGPDDLIRPTEVLMELLRRPFEYSGQTLYVSASIGGAIYPCHADGPRQLHKKADIALYQAKACGRNRLVTYEPAIPG